MSAGTSKELEELPRKQAKVAADPKRDFCAMGFGTADNNVGVDHAPGYMRAAAIVLAVE